MLEAGDNGVAPGRGGPRGRRRAGADRADRGRPRGAPVRRRAAAVAARDRAPSPAPTAKPSTRAWATSRSRSAVAASGSCSHGDRVELATAPEAGALIARYVGADAVRLSPASLETLAIVAYRQPVTRAGDRAHPRRRLRLHGPDAAASPADRRARPVGCAGPAVPLRHRLRLPRALRADQPRRAAAARRRCRGALAEEGGEDAHRREPTDGAGRAATAGRRAGEPRPA